MTISIFVWAQVNRFSDDEDVAQSGLMLTVASGAPRRWKLCIEAEQLSLADKSIALRLYLAVK